MKGGWIYIVTNQAFGSLCIGVTSDIVRRVGEHRAGVTDGFTRWYGLKRLAYAEWHDEITSAIKREKNLKHWIRDWKIALIMAANPNWDDLYPGFL
jgi:putative endonuclease